jgi:hypothetical protein
MKYSSFQFPSWLLVAGWRIKSCYTGQAVENTHFFSENRLPKAFSLEKSKKALKPWDIFLEKIICAQTARQNRFHTSMREC